METKQDQPIIHFASAAEWEAWLEENHAGPRGVWLKIAKKDSGVASVTHAEALDVALCHGWIDAQRTTYDGQFFLQRFTRRVPRSKWSKINCAKVEALAAQGRMRPAGTAEVEAAKADGRWERAYEGQRTMTVPDDLRTALDENPRAAEFFAGLSSQNRYAILFRIHDAKKPETRARRIEKFVAMLEAGEKFY
jgi:uncharacterized protein YdeI (YjbR/CyaY-like superfamily)